MNKIPTILLIEDDTVLRENTAELLELSNYQVVTAPNGRLGIAQALKTIPNLVICDIMMPEIDGYGVLEALADHPKTQHIPFIFLSAKTEHREVRKGMDLGADDYLTKPCDEQDLLNAISSRLAKAQILEQAAEGKSNSASQQESKIRNVEQLANFIEDQGAYETYKKGDTVFTAGDRSHYIYLIKEGVVKIFTMDENGKELITSLQKEGSFIGLSSILDNELAHESATALTDSTLIKISKTEFVAVLSENREVTLDLIHVLADDLTATKEHLLQMAYSSVRKKTAHTILQFAEILNHNTQDPIKISRHDLASVAGIATESLIRTLSSFKKDGWIEIEGRNISILDLDALESML